MPYLQPHQKGEAMTTTTRKKAPRKTRPKLARSPSHVITEDSALRKFRVASGLPTLHECREELDEYVAVLMGETPPPIANGVMTLHEVANTYLSRALTITMLVQRAETEGYVAKGAAWYKFRTGELRTFTELASKASELGSRRVTAARLEFDMKEEAT